MQDVLPLLAVPGAVAYLAWQQRPVRGLHADLRTAIAAHHGGYVADAGSASLAAVAGALTLPASAPQVAADVDAAGTAACRPTAGRAREVRELIRPLGLDLIEVLHVADEGRRDGRPAGAGKTVLGGWRYGRAVAVELHDARSEIRISEALEPFVLAASGQRWHCLDEAPEPVRDAIEALAPSRRWDGLQVVAGPAGLMLRREDAPAPSWMHDLWLAELLTDHALRAQASLA